MGPGRKERDVIVQRRGNRCWRGGRERRSRVLIVEGRMKFGEGLGRGEDAGGGGRCRRRRRLGRPQE